MLARLALIVFSALVAVLLGCLIVLPAQLAINFSNDYFDSDQPNGFTFILKSVI